MASVRLTRDLKQTITSKSSSAFLTADPRPQANNEFQAAIKEALYKTKHQQFMRKINNQFTELNLSDDFKSANEDCCLGGLWAPKKSDDITSLYLYTSNAARRTERSLEINFDTPFNILTTSTRYHLDTDLNLDALEEDDQPKLMGMYSELKNARTQWANRRDSFDRTIETTLDNSNTVRQALDIFPGIESFIPPAILQKLTVKVTRAQRAQTVRDKITIDTTAANQVILTAKIVGG